MSVRSLLLLAACLLPPLVAGAVDPSISTQLLWPTPSSVSVGHLVLSIDSTTFKFTTQGGGMGSDTLNQAIERYTDIIFKTPVPFYPSAANVTTTSPLSGLTITVSSGDEILGLNTDESCECHGIFLVEDSYLFQDVYSLQCGHLCGKLLPQIVCVTNGC